MNTEPAAVRPEADDPRVLALAKARQQLAHENPFNAVCPPWEGLSEQEQHLSLLNARSYLHAALKAGLAPAAVPVPPPTDQTALRDRIAKVLAGAALKPPFPHCLAMADAVLAVLPELTDRAAVLREAADHLARQADELWAPGTTAHTVMHANADELRQLVDAAPTAEARPEPLERNFAAYQAAIVRVALVLREARKHREQTDPSERQDCVMCGADHFAEIRDAIKGKQPDAGAWQGEVHLTADDLDELEAHLESTDEMVDELNETIAELTQRATRAEPPADRSAVYAEVADRLAADAEQGDKEGFTRIYRRSAAKQVREWGEELRRLAADAQPEPPRRWCKCRTCWGWFVEAHPGEDLDELGKDLGWWSGLPVHRDAPAGAQPITKPETDDDEALRAKVDEATATLRRMRSVIKHWEQQALPHSQAHRLLTEVRDALAGPRPDPETATQPTEEEIIRKHVTTVHLIGEQLAGIETWMWEHLANVRDATKAQPAAEPLSPWRILGIANCQTPATHNQGCACTAAGVRQDGAQPSEPPVVAYRSDGGRLLNCLRHVPPPAARHADFHPVTAEDLPDGGICTYPDCGVDVLIPQENRRG